MFKIHTSDGLTVRVDLDNEEQAQEWLKRLKDPNFQDTITGISVVQRCGGKFRCPTCGKAARLTCTTCGLPPQEIICGTGVQYSLSRPTGFGKANYLVERMEPNANGKIRGGEKVTCFVGDVRLTMMIHAAQPSTRISLLKIGEQRYNPYVD